MPTSISASMSDDGCDDDDGSSSGMAAGATSLSVTTSALFGPWASGSGQAGKS
jgi:hypothetical protein